MPNVLRNLGNWTGLDFLAPNGRLIWFGLITFAMIGLAAKRMRAPKPDRETTWAEAMGGAVYVFALFLLMYAVIPHEFITVSDKYWGSVDQPGPHQVHHPDSVQPRLELAVLDRPPTRSA